MTYSLANPLRTLAVLMSVLAGLAVGPALAQDASQDEDLAKAVVGAAHAAPEKTGPSAPAAAAASYCQRRLGAWFYCAAPEPPAQTPDTRPAAAPPRQLEELEAYQKQVDEALKVASWDPTPENVERYMRLQRVALDKSALMSDLWRRLVWTTPDLDYTLERPTTSLAKNEADNERGQDRDIFLREVADQVGVFYVFSRTCGPCRVASPIVKAFADRFGVPVRVISTDGASNPVFGPTMADRGQLASWGIDHTVTPALLIYQSPSPIGADGAPVRRQVASADGRRMTLRPCLQARGCLTYLGAGVLSVEDIAERFFVLLSKDPGSDY
jgi:conjugal transfer pilus assembly protein TraF